MKKKIAGLFLIVGIVVTGVGGYFWWEKNRKLQPPSAETDKKPPAEEWGNIYDIPPFTPNDNKKFPVLWSVRWKVKADNGWFGGPGCVSHPDYSVVPWSIVFVKFSDDTDAEMKIGTPGDRKTLPRGRTSWTAIRFVPPGNTGEIKIAKREPFVVCNTDRNAVIHAEARKWRP